MIKKLYVEVADTPIKRETGLMGRKQLSSDRGMLFKFPNKMKLSFWMKDTYIPLDIAFVDDDGKILQIEQMSPLNTKSIRSVFPCKYAIETNKNWFKDNHVGVGDYIDGLLDWHRYAQNKSKVNVNPMSNEEYELLNRQMDKSIQQRLMTIDKHNKIVGTLGLSDKLVDVIIMYYTLDHGKQLLPRICRGPFSFEAGVNTDELVRLNDMSPAVSGTNPGYGRWECLPGEKTLAVENIMSMQEIYRNDPYAKKTPIIFDNINEARQFMSKNVSFNAGKKKKGKK